MDYAASYGEPTCPTCSKPLTVDFSAKKYDQEPKKPKTSFKGFKSSSIINRIRLENFQTSTKIDALVCDPSMLSLIKVAKRVVWVGWVMSQNAVGFKRVIDKCRSNWLRRV